MQRMLALIVVTGVALGGSARAQQGQQCTGSVQYGGGALIHTVKLVAVYWGAAPSDAASIGQAYAKIVQSPYFDWLREYDQGSNTIRRGTFVGTYADSAPPASQQIDDQQDIQPWLTSLITAHKVPAPDADTMYMLHFPPGVVITQGGDQSCQAFCAYHDSYQSGGMNIRYGVIPDQMSGGCENGCGSGATAVDRTVEVASHELVEAVTDPDGGTGWTNNQCGEIGDICVGQPGTANGVEVQLEWSNKQNGCIDHDSSVTVADFSLALGAPPTAAPGGSATATVTATPASGSQAASANLSLVGLPDGVTATVSPNPVMTNAAATVTFSVPSGTALGSYPFTVVGATVSDNVVESVSGTLVVANDSGSGNPGDGSGNGDGSGGGTEPGAGGSGGSSGGSGASGNGATNPPAASGGCSLSGAAAPAGALPLLVLLALGLATRRRPVA